MSISTRYRQSLVLTAAVLFSVCSAFLLGADVPTFNANQNIGTGVDGITVTCAGDLNNDGLVDVAVFEGGKHNSSPTFAWYEAPDWTRHEFNTDYSVTPFIGDAEIGDINGDGLLDILVPQDGHSTGPGFLYWYENPGNGSTGKWPRHFIGEWANSYHLGDVDLADMDNDGKMDAVVRHLGDMKVRICFQNSSDDWTVRSFNVKAREGMKVADLDRDGTMDIVLNGFWWAGPSDPRTGTYQEFNIAEIYYTQEVVRLNNSTKNGIGDIDGDGIDDVVFSPAEGTATQLAWYRCPADPRTQAWTEYVIQSGITGYHQAEIADMDNDGDLDIVTGKSFGGSGLYTWLMGDNGTTWNKITISSANGLYNGAVADIGNDGDFDVIGGNQYANHSQLYLHENLIGDSGPVNNAPSVDAGSARTITLPADTVSLNGTVTDADGDPLSTLWSRESGPGTVSFGNPNNVDTTAQFSDAGIYILKLTADDGTVSSSDTVTITVNPEPGLPVDAFSRIEAEDYIDMSGLGIYDGGTGQKIGSIHNGEWASYNIDFGSGASQFDASCASDTDGGTIELRLDAADGYLVGSVSVPGTGSWNSFIDVSCSVNGASGVHVLYLVFTGPTGYLVDVDYFQFSAAAANTPPVADAGGNQSITLPDNSAALNGTVSDADGDALTVSWTKQSGPGTVTFGNASDTDTTASFSEEGAYVLKLTVSDGTDTVSDTVAITVNPETTAVLDAFSRIEAEDFDDTLGVGIYDGGTGQKIGNTQDGDWVSYLIDFGTGVNQFDARGASRLNGGTVELRLDASDGTLIGSVDIPDTNDWNTFVDVSCSVAETSGIHTLFLVFAGPDKYLVDIDYFQFSMISSNTSPTADMVLDVYEGYAPLSIRFDGSGSADPEGGALSCYWDFGDGTDANGVTVSHTYGTPGEYTATLTVTDEGGLSDIISEIIMVDVNPSDVLSVSLVQPSNYDVCQLFTGSIYYVDRSYTVISMPALFEGEWGIRTANDDKYVSFADHLVFEVNQAVDVYVVYDNRAFNKVPYIPDWMSSFSDTGMTLEVKDGGATPMHVYKKEYSAGIVTLGGNYSGGSTGARSNYMVFVLPRGGTLDDQLLKPVSAVSAKAGSEWWYNEGDTDGDGLTDEFELDNGLDPTSIDTDTDTIVDEDETDENGNPLFDILNNLTDNSVSAKIDAAGGCSYCENNGSSIGVIMILLVIGLGTALRRK